MTIRFRLENDEIADYFRERTVALYNMISESGYRLSVIQFQTGAEPVTPMNALKK